MKTNFTHMLIAANDLESDNFQTWVFCRQMLFNASGKWWGDYGLRDFPHEGIDLCLYADGSGGICQLGAKTRIPAMHDGRVKALFRDYLGQAVIVEHSGGEGDSGIFLSAYAHTTPLPGIEPGANVTRGDIIATIADTRRSKSNILPHLHFSFGRPSADLVYEPFEWNIMRDPGLVALRDPLALIDGPSQVLETKNRFCSPS